MRFDQSRMIKCTPASRVFALIIIFEVRRSFHICSYFTRELLTNLHCRKIQEEFTYVISFYEDNAVYSKEKLYHYQCFFYQLTISIGLATKRLRILSLGGIDKIRNHLVANPTLPLPHTFLSTTRQFPFNDIVQSRGKGCSS